MLNASQPIGIFDSGVGGLTVANAVKNLLPDEQIIYFGDTAHLPYGDKSGDLIRQYSKGIASFLLQNQCKVILIACNTASAHAFSYVKEFIGDQAIVLDVIEPVIENIASKNHSKIGVIGTKGTINSGAYQKKINHLNPHMEIVSMATPLLVPMIEEGFVFDDISNAIIRSYLSNEKLSGIESLILGCTHYPIIKNQIRKFYNFHVNIIDSSQIVANHLKEILTKFNIRKELKSANHKFFVSDYTTIFEAIARMFFDDDISLEKIDFWK